MIPLDKGDIHALFFKVGKAFPLLKGKTQKGFILLGRGKNF
jgi:hypothetical protein